MFYLIGMSYSWLNVKESCAFCGNKDNLKLCDTPYSDTNNFNEYKFCNRKCNQRYLSWVKTFDLSVGLPYHIKILGSSKNNYNSVCHYCGSESNSLIEIPYYICENVKFSFNFDSYTFCKNNICLKLYISYLNEKKLPTPFIINKLKGCQCVVVKQSKCNICITTSNCYNCACGQTIVDQ